MTRTPVEEIKERLSILEVVGQYVELHKAGKHYKGKSPFTNEKTPSFFVSPDRGVYFCFSSQKGGDMFTFIQEMEGVDFKGALKILAERAHVELVPENPKSRDERETQYALLEEATQFFIRKREEHEHVEAYIADRGVKATTVHTWRVGYAPDEWRALRSYLRAKGYTDEAILRAGLIKRTETGKEPYDVFRDRVMFPICDASGRVVAFSGRTLKKEEGIPKYVNSPETELYQKSEILYGYDKAKSGIRHFDFSIIVEGQFDLVLSHQIGYQNTVAVSGTALTPHHVMLLMRLSNRAVLSLDSDRAGIAAVKRSAGLMLKAGMDVKVVHIEGGKDPADIIKSDPGAFKHFVGSAVHVIEFLLKALKQDAKDERAYKLQVREEVLPLLATMENRIDREHFENIVADAIGTTKDAVQYEMGRMQASQGHAIEHKVAESLNVTAGNTKRRHGTTLHLLALTHVLESEHAWIKIAIEERLHQIFTPELSSLILDEDDPQWHESCFVAERYIESANESELIRHVEETITTLAQLVARERLSALREQIQEAERTGDEASLMSHLTKTKEFEALLQSSFKLTKPSL